MTTQSSTQKSSFIPLAIVAGLFFILGFNTWLNGSLMPYLEQVLSLTPLQATFILFAFYISSTIMAIPSAWVINRIGYKNSMALALGGVSIAAFMYIPAAETHVFALFLLAQFVMGASQTLLQTAVNPYVVKIGPEESAAARICLMGILNKTAGIVAPLVFTALILGDMSHSTTAPTPEQKEALADNLIMPYVFLGLIIALFAALIKFSPLPELNLDEESADVVGGGLLSRFGQALCFPQLSLGVIALAFYVGVEVVAADTIGSFARSIGYADYSQLTAYTMGCMLLGYVLGIICIPRFISQSAALSLSAVLGLVLGFAIIGSDPASTSISQIFAALGMPAVPNPILLIAFLGLANAIMWPAIWPLALSGLGRLTSTASALLIMAIAGGGILSMIWGYLSTNEDIGRQSAYLVVIPAYLFILFYAVKGHKIRRKK